MPLVFFTGFSVSLFLRLSLSPSSLTLAPASLWQGQGGVPHAQAGEPLVQGHFATPEAVVDAAVALRGVHASEPRPQPAAEDAHHPHSGENIPALPASDWFLVRVYPHFLRPIGPS
eukprot:875450-Prorocentrum_minimum.AAC.1